MKILIVLLFKNSSLWIRRFLSCLDSLLENLENRNKGITYDLSILYGTSTDNTEQIVKNYVNILNESSELSRIVNTYDKLLNLPRRLDSLERLSVLRNTSIYRMDHVDESIDNLKSYDYVFQIDTDTIFDVPAVIKLIETIDNDNKNKNRDKIGAIAPMVYIDKSHPDSEDIFYDTFAFRYFSDKKNNVEEGNINGEMFKIRDPYFPEYRKEGIIDGNIHEVYSIGTFYICRADLFWKYGVKYQTEIRKNLDLHPQRKLESEQVVFCRNVRLNTPYKVYIDKSICIYHIDLPKYGMCWH